VISSLTLCVACRLHTGCGLEDRKRKKKEKEKE
jgi:hypothetical protein